MHKTVALRAANKPQAAMQHQLNKKNLLSERDQARLKLQPTHKVSTVMK